MQQPTTNSSSNESPIGVASRLCSVCGDISTGKDYLHETKCILTNKNLFQRNSFWW